MADIYANFADLAANETEGKDFRIVVKEGRSGIVIVAPHAGKIEVHTSSIAAAIALQDHALYLFEGYAARKNRRLHVTSEQFEDFVIVGGRNARAKALVLAALAKFSATDVGPAHLLGNSAGNICNRAREAGVQLEISLGIRNKLGGAGRRPAPAHADAHMREFAELNEDVGRSE